jgi:hypothetical protein
MPAAKGERTMSDVPVGRALIALFTGVLLSAVATPAQTIWYVDDDAGPGGDGTSWSTAFSDLQGALEASDSDDEICVTGGTYVPSVSPDPADPRKARFYIPHGVALYGGYAGLSDPNDPDTRDVILYETAPSGDRAGNDGPDFANYDENCYHVVAGWEGGNLLDGFTITGGQRVSRQR